MAKQIADTTIFGRLFMAALSNDWSGFDGGIFQFKVISKPENPKLKAVRVVLYRLVFWFSLQKVSDNGNH